MDQENMSRDGYRFLGWYVDEQRTKRINPAGELPRETQLYAKWEPISYPVTYELDKGINSRRNPRSISVESGVIKLFPAQCDGLQFAGWFKDGQRVDYLEEGIVGPVHLVGKFQHPAQVQFDSDGGSRISPRSPDLEGHLDHLPVPLRPGYTFLGWYKDSLRMHPWYEEDICYDSMTLYADWALTEFPIVYDLDGGMLVGTPILSYTKITPTFLLPKAVKDNCTFAGWHDERNNLHMMIRKGSIGPRKLIARWRSEPEEKVFA